MTDHWPSIADPGVVCSCGFKVAGVTFTEAKRRWAEHALAETWDEGMRWGQVHWATNYGINGRVADNPYRDDERP